MTISSMSNYFVKCISERVSRVRYEFERRRTRSNGDQILQLICRATKTLEMRKLMAKRN